MNRIHAMSLTIIAVFILFTACSNGTSSSSTPTPATAQQATKRIGVVLDVGAENDRSFNQYTLEGARKAAEEASLDLSYVVSETGTDYEQIIFKMADQGIDLIITVGFQMGPATAKAAQQYPDTHFAIVDNAYYPGAGCPETFTDCYTEDGGLSNVTSLMFAENEMAYLAGVMAACMSESHTIGVVAGMEIPPVVRIVTGVKHGAESFDPDTTVLLSYHPAFNDPGSGKVTGQNFINQGADVIIGAGGSTGNGGLLAAHEADAMAIGVDVDQYETFPEVRESLLTSALKNVDVAAASAVGDFAAGQLQAGIRIATLENNGVGLAPYHDWEEKIPQECKDAVESARQAVIADPSVTGIE